MNKKQLKDNIMKSYYAGDIIDSSDFESLIEQLLDLIDFDKIEPSKMKQLIFNYPEFIETNN